MRSLIIDRLEAPPEAGEGEWTDSAFRGDGDLNPGVEPWHKGPLRPAAVLVPLVERAEGMTVLLTKRTDHLHDHAGQISFPGGRVEPHDDSPVATALRETEEEVGLTRDHINVVGRLDTYRTGTGYAVTPVVGLVTPGFTLMIDSFEVAEVFEVPLDFLMNPENHQKHSGVFRGVERHWYAMPYGDYYIWGATAGMLVNLSEKIQHKG